MILVQHKTGKPHKGMIVKWENENGSQSSNQGSCGNLASNTGTASGTGFTSTAATAKNAKQSLKSTVVVNQVFQAKEGAVPKVPSSKGTTSKIKKRRRSLCYKCLDCGALLEADATLCRWVSAVFLVEEYTLFFLSTTEFTILSRTIGLQGWMSDVPFSFFSRWDNF